MMTTQKDLLRLTSPNPLARLYGNLRFRAASFESLKITSATPEGLAKIFKHLRESGLASKIRILNLSNNGLTYLPEGLFEGLVALEDLYLEHNKIDILSANQFQGLRALRYLNLSYNQINTLSESQFHELKALEHLNFSHNQIRTLAENQFRGLRALETLALGHNQIIDPVNLSGLRLMDYCQDNNFQLSPNNEITMLPNTRPPDAKSIWNHIKYGYGFDLHILNHAIENKAPWGSHFNEKQIKELVEKRGLALKQKR